VVHFHHFLLLGLDLLTLTRRVLPQVRIVFTFHEFLAICAADGQMLRTTDRTLCSRASSVRCHQCFPARGPEQFFMREMWMKRHLAVVDAFTTPSRFMIEHYVGWGLERRLITHVTNGQPDYSLGVIPSEPRTTRNRFGYFGQMVDNKGIWVILRAVRQLRAEGFTAFSIEINGDNLRYASEARRAEIEAFRQEEEARPFAEQIVFFNGPYQTEQLAQRMARVDWCVVPSVWWEIFGLVISEAWMFRRPVIASNVGGPAERVRHDVDGLLFNVADSHALALAIRRASTEDGLWDRLAAGIAAPARADAMADSFMSVYGNGPDRSAA
jgi:glycosyltransferase involved in cell wall biosynthesis